MDNGIASNPVQPAIARHYRVVASQPERQIHVLSPLVSEPAWPGGRTTTRRPADQDVRSKPVE
ncbi:uncharacterized protein BO80DRAFT_424467 [Aspergillus ibericus CBS 121593]|uniref:Uncharacterized protein n=1 Tax=Aspergillus ibericus CBS 121593 TaxID=1448316 RepID=A0A395H193_9EURO|nr:hypothetical protein BO80DRAFT_424467 [Aspergillus ibericus CBS 121593]RAL01636.1 hypothetical protein BO80DRAFT_424467 [Aspergillus ibericus CBS 121593]